MQQKPQLTKKQNSNRNGNKRTLGTTNKILSYSTGYMNEITPIWAEIVGWKSKPVRAVRPRSTILVRVNGDRYSEMLKKIKANHEVNAASNKIVETTKTKNLDLLLRIDRKKEVSNLLIDTLSKSLGGTSL